jgi:hypothetical protein
MGRAKKVSAKKVYPPGSSPTPGSDNTIYTTQSVSNNDSSSTPGSGNIIPTTQSVTNNDSSSTPGTGIIISTTQSVTNNDSSSTPGTGIIISTTQSVTNNDSSSSPGSGIIIPTTQSLTNNDSSSTPGPSSSTMQSGVSSKRPRMYLTKNKKLLKKQKEKQEKKISFEKAVRDMHRGKFKSLRKCSSHHKVPLSTLYRLLTTGDEFKGSGRSLDCLSVEEEAEIIQHIKWRAMIGCGVDFGQLQSLIQESLLALKSANPDRKTGYEETGQLPNKDYVRRMVARNNLSLRRTAEISKGMIKVYFILKSLF